MGNTNALKHGIYRAHLTEEEREAYDALTVGQLDDELRLARIRLSRTLQAEKDKPDAGTDYSSIIDRQLGRIEGLEWTRKRILGKDGGDDEMPRLIDEPLQRGSRMAIFEAAGIAINTRLVAYVGPVKAPRATSAEFSVMCSGASLPLKLNFDTQREAETARRKLLGLIDAHDSHPR